MFDEIFIKGMSSIDAYNYGRQMMEKELNEIHLCECNQIIADAENRMSRILDDEKRLSYQQGRADAIDECVKTLAKSEDTILSDRQYYTLMELKEQKE